MEIKMDEVIKNYPFGPHSLGEDVIDWIIVKLTRAGITDKNLVLACILFIETDYPDWLDKEIVNILFDYTSGNWNYQSKIVKLIDILTDLKFNHCRYRLDEVEKYFDCNSYLESEIRKRIN